MVTIENDILKVRISNYGAELQSVTAKRTGKEYIWPGKPEIWSEHAPVLFPICGRLCGDTYLYNGIPFSLRKHGFAKRNDFETESASRNEATFLLKSDADTRLKYPFDYEFRTSFKADGNRLISTYSVKNTDSRTIYFSLGAHPAYNVPLGGRVVFDKKQDLTVLTVDGDGYINGRKMIAKNTDTVVLQKDTFIDDALIFEAPSFTSAMVQSPEGKTLVKMDFGKIPYLLLWAKPGADYVCIEPWYGVPDSEGIPGEIKNKKGIVSLDPGKTFSIETVAEFF